MIIDSKGKLFGKVSIIDIIIVLVIVIAIAGVGYKFVKSKTASVFVKPDQIEIMFYQEDAIDAAAKAIKTGDTAVEQEQNSVFGKVTNVKIDKSIFWGNTPVGNVVPFSKEGYSSVMITVAGEGFFTDSGVKIGTGTYYIGRSIIYKVGNSVFYGKIYEIKKKE